jgi:hypothetical protein
MKVHRHDVSSWVVWTASGQLIVKLCSGWRPCARMNQALKKVKLRIYSLENG